MMEDKYDQGIYKPAACNIGPEEIKRRYRIGMVGLVVSILLILYIELLQPDRGWKLLLFIPVFYSVSGFIQARKKFCYVYGYKGVFSTAGRKKFKRVESQYVKEERKKAFRLVILITFCSVIITAIYYLLFP